MTGFAGRPISYLYGLDKRALSGQITDYYRGRIRWSDIADPTASKEWSVRSPECARPLGQTLIVPQRPWVVTTCPGGNDALGQSYPAGTVFVVVANSGAGGNFRPPGNVTNPLTITATLNGGNTLIYYASKIPAGASGTVTFKNGVTTLATLSINGANGEEQILIAPAFGAATSYVSSWSGGLPLTENLAAQIGDDKLLSFWAVPDTLPGAFTFRADSDTERGGTFQYRNHADKTRTKSYPNQSYETLGLGITVSGATLSGSDFSFGVLDLIYGNPNLNNSSGGAFGAIPQYNCWISGFLQKVGYTPMAKNGVCYTNTNPGWSAFTFFVPTVSTLTTQGLRYLEVNGSDINGNNLYQKFTADPLVGDTLTLTVRQDGTVISTLVYTGAAIKSIPKTAITVTLPSHGTNTVFTLTVSYSGATSSTSPYWHVGVCFNGSPRCDIPFPFSAVGPGNIVAPGGYLASSLGTPTNNQPLTRLAAGVTTQSVSTLVTLAYLPAADGWQKVIWNTLEQVGIGEDEFNWLNRSNVQRGHANRSFYCKIAGAGIAHNAVLTSYTPSPTAVAGLTTLDMTPVAHLHWAWASYATSGARDYTISVCLFDVIEMQNGITVEISGTDTTCLTYEKQVYLETYDELWVNTSVQSALVYKGTSNTPPGSPTSGDAWGTLSAPTGLWAGHPNQIAIYDGFSGNWIFLTPRTGGYMMASSTVFAIWTGTAWVTAFGVAVWNIVYSSTTAAIYMAFSSYSTERSSTPGKIQVSVV